MSTEQPEVIKKSFEQTQKLREILHFIEDSERDVMIFTGPAGSGKSTIMRDLVEYMDNEHISYWLTAPTGSAAYNLSTRTNREVKTLHGQLYQFSKIIEEKEDLFKMVFGFSMHNETPRVIIVDEASLISNTENQNDILKFGSNKLLEDLITFRSKFDYPPKFIFIGDRFQLSPINMNEAPALSKRYLEDEFNLKVSTCELTEIHRQSDPFILETLKGLRHQIEHKDESRVKWYGNGPKGISKENIPNFVSDTNPFKQPNQSAVLAFTNAQVLEYNQLIREGYDFQEVLDQDDLLLSIRNMYFYDGSITEFNEHSLLNVPNGTLIKVNSVQQEVETRKVTLKGADNVEKVIVLSFKEALVTPMIKKVNRPIRIKILLNTLTMNSSSLPQEQWRALFVDFLIRNKGLMEQRKTIKKDTFEHEQWLIRFGNVLRSDAYFNALMAKYGYALTVHKAQGHEWKNVIVDTYYKNGVHKIEGLRWLYTACSRTKGSLLLLNKEGTGLMAKCDFNGIEPLKNIPPAFYGEDTRKPGSNDPKVVHQFPFLKAHIEHLEQAARKLHLDVSVDVSRPYMVRTVWRSESHQFMLDFSYKKKGMKEVVIKQDMFDRSTLYRSVINEIQHHTKPYYLPKPKNEEEATFRTELKKVLDLYQLKLCNVVYKEGDYLIKYHIEGGEGKGILEVWQDKNLSFTAAQLKTEMGGLAKVYSECMHQIFTKSSE